MLKNKFLHYSTVLLALAVFVGFNLLSYVVHLRFDATEGQIYTLSDSTKKIASEVPDGVTIKVFLSKKLPPQVASSEQRLKDLLAEYVAAGSNIDLEYVDPASDEEALMLAKALQIPELSLQVIEKDQRQVLQVYFGLAVLQDAEEEPEEDAGSLAAYAKYETIPSIQNFSSFEYDLTAALRKVSVTDLQTIGFLVGHSEHEPKTLKQPTNQYEAMMMTPTENADYPILDTLEKTYEVSTLSASSISEVDTLIVAGPKEPLSDADIAAVHSFVAAGGNAILLLDGMHISEMMMASEHKVAQAELLAPWGLTIRPELIADSSHAQAPFNKGFMTFSLPYPLWLKVRDLSSSHAATAQMNSFVLPWASPIAISEQEGVTTEVLARTSNRYQTIMETVTPAPEPTEGEEPAAPRPPQPINLNPQQDFGISNNIKSPLPLVVLAQKEGEGSVIVVGDADFATDKFGYVMNDGQEFLLNAIDAFTLGDELISIRSKGVTDRPLDELSEGMKNLLEWGNILGMSIVFVIYGLIRRQLRLAKKNSAMLG